MEPYRLYVFCSLTNSVFVERGSHGGDDGYWFVQNETHRRTFVTSDEIEHTIQCGRRELVGPVAERHPAAVAVLAS